MKTKEEKARIAAGVAELLKRSQTTVLADYRGLNVAQDTKLRQKLRKAGVDYRVIKNTITERAAKEAGIEGLEPYLAGPVSIAFGYDDPTQVAKILTDFARANKELEIKAGIFEGKVISAERVHALAILPPREVLLAQVAGQFRAPLAGLASVLAGPLRQFAYAVEALRQKKEAESPAA
ncbi:MAG TPA: 50S ribosomal protein L10 [Bacillota bacterium]|jgi:large subunit ribosomal protein L10